MLIIGIGIGIEHYLHYAFLKRNVEDSSDSNLHIFTDIKQLKHFIVG